MGDQTLGDLCVEVIDCEHKTAPEDPLGQFWSIGTPAMAGNKIDYAQAKRISEDTYRAWTRRSQPEAGDIILAREAPVGPVVRVPDSPRVALGQRTVLLRPDRRVVDPGFLYYGLVGDEMQALMHSRAEGSTVAHLNVAEVRELRFIDLPSLKEQQAIAGVLGSLDDKIESNRRTDRLALELLASTWITYASEAPTGRVGQIATLSTQRVLDGSAEVTVLSATSAGLLVPSDEFFEKRVYSKDISKYLLVHPWAFAYNPSRANIGSIGLNTGPGLGAVSPVYVVAQTAGPPSAWWLELALRTPQVRNDIEAFSTGSVRQVLRFDDLASIEIPLPVADALDRFFTDVDPLIQLRERVASESRTLESLRDSLLPELLSGRLRVREVEEMVGSV